MIKSLRLEGFRNLEGISLEFSEGVNLFYGPNGAGKTNLLEALGIFTLSKSCRGAKDKMLVGYSRELAEVWGRLAGRKKKEDITIRITASGQRKILLDGYHTIRQNELVGRLPAVFIFPEDIELTAGPASFHRQFLDLYISQVDRAYLDALVSYQKVVAQRNKLLKDIAGSRAEKAQLSAWDKLLIVDATRIIAGRGSFVESISGAVAGYYGDFDDKKSLALTYMPKLARDEDDIRRALEKWLDFYRSRELKAGVTLVGPHRDRLEITLDGRSVRHFASRGQKRCAMLAMKLAAAEFLSSAKGEPPALILDEVFAELDLQKSKALMKMLRRPKKDSSWRQVFIASVDKLEVKEFPVTIFKVENGKVNRG